MIKKIDQNKYLRIVFPSRKIIIKSIINKWSVWIYCKMAMYNLLLIFSISVINVYLMLWIRKIILVKISIYPKLLIISKKCNSSLISHPPSQKLKLGPNLLNNKNNWRWTSTILSPSIIKIKAIFLQLLISIKELLS